MSRWGWHDRALRTPHPQGWSLHKFSDTTWRNTDDFHRRIYLANAYRVLLTRARQGMVIFVPQGNAADATRTPGLYDGTWGFLRECGVPVLAG